MGALLSATLLAVLVGGAAPASAQEATGVLEVTDAVFTAADGSTPNYFSFGQPVHAFLDLYNPGTEPVTGVTATLAFERGEVAVATASFPDVAPGATVRNAEPFVFAYGEISEAEDVDAGCVIFFDGLDVDEDDVVIDETEGDVITPTDPETDPSDPFEDIPPGGLIFTVVSDQGDVEYVHTWAAVCSAFSEGGGGPIVRRDDLPATGSTPIVGAIGVALSMLGVGMRRRARAR